MTARVAPTERIRAQIDELFASEGDLGDVLEEVARLATRLLLQASLEAEVTEFLGRDRYERRSKGVDPKEGSRNGHSAAFDRAGVVRVDRRLAGLPPEDDRTGTP